MRPFNDFPLSSSQMRILLAELKYEGTRAYHIGCAIPFEGDRAELVKAAIPCVFSGNLQLRVRKNSDGSYMQYASDDDPKWREIDASGLGDEAVERLLASLSEEPISPLFDAPLYRIFVIRRDAGVLFYGIFHHLISDGTTLLKVLPERFDECISALEEGREPLRYDETYHTYIENVGELRRTEESQDNKQYWVDRLTGFRGPAYDAGILSKGSVELEIPAELTEKLQAVQKANRISPFVLGLGSVFLYFAEERRRLGADITEMVWEISVHGRYYGEETAGDTGMYVETLPLRLTCGSERSFAESIIAVKDVMKGGLAHSRTDINQVLNELGIKGVELKSLTSFSAVSNSVTGGSKARIYLPDETDVPFHVRVNLNRRDEEGLTRLTFEYNSTIFEKRQILEIRDGVLKLLLQGASDPLMAVGDMELPESGLIRAECVLSRNLAATDEPVSLQSGVRPDSAEAGDSAGAGGVAEAAGTRKDASMTDRVRFTAALADTIVRFGMTKDLLIGVRGSRGAVPFGLNVDTSTPAREFAALIREKLEEVEELRTAQTASRADISFKPSIVLAFAGEEGERAGAEFDDDTLLEFSQGNRGVTLRFRRDRYTDEYIDALFDSIRLLYGNMDKETALRDIRLLEAEDKDHTIVLKNEGTVNAVFDRMAAEYPDKEILKASDRTLTYGELRDEAVRAARGLIKKGVSKGDRVLILMHRTSSLVVSIFGVLKAGAVFITMDPTYPRERIEQILEDSRAAVVLTDISGIAENVDRAVTYESLTAAGNEGVGDAGDDREAGGAGDSGKAGDAADPGISVTPDDMCFIIYTSGTTGRPKGVVLTHRGITNYIAPEKENAPIWFLKDRCSRMLCLSSVSFIVFLREIFGTVLNGIPVVLCDEEQAVNPVAIAGLIKDCQIDAMGSTPTRLLQYCEVPAFAEAIARVKLMIIGGEAFPPRLFDVLRAHSACEIYNSYGPTEVTIASHQKRLESPKVSAGYPMLNVWDRVADPDGNALPPYAVGELYVGGAGVAMGYFGDEELTREHFPVIDGERFCNTGDLAYRDRSGEMFVLGRNDGMIKLRGLRIELEEVENAVGRCRGVGLARVVVRTINGTEYLCAFYTLAKGAGTVTGQEIRKEVSRKLPPYMVPSYYTEIPAFPMTPNGKISVRGLKELPVNGPDGMAFEAPSGEVEKELSRAVSEILKTDQFGVTDDLFLMGLTSLTMISLVSEIYEKYGVSIRVTELMERRTIRDIARLVEGELKAGGAAASDSQTAREEGPRRYYPLTDSQMGIYLECEAHPDGTGYHLPNYIRFAGNVRPGRLKNAVVRVLSQHPYLKSTLETVNGNVVIKRNDDAPVDDLITIETVQSFTEQTAADLASAPFDLLGGFLFRVRIFAAENEVVLFTTFHHLIVDGTSLNIIFRDIAAAYDGRPLTEEKTDGFAVSLSEDRARSSALYEKSREYFESVMREAGEATVLAPDKKSDEAKGELGVWESCLESGPVDEFCERHNISQNVLFMSAMAVALTKFNSEEKILLATVSNGRLDPALKDTAALLVKTLPLSLSPDRSGSIEELFSYVSGVWMNTMTHQDYPFTRISGEYDFHPQFFYTYHGKIYEEIRMSGAGYIRERVDFDSLRYKFMLGVILDDRYMIRVQYNDALYSGSYVKTFAEAVKKLVLMWTGADDLGNISVKDIALSEEPRYDFHPLKKVMVHQMFQDMVSAEPDRPILTASGETLTYRELNCMANRIANALIKRGVREGGSVVLLLKRTPVLIASMLGTLKAGAAYIPMDVEYPKERVSYVVEDAGANFVITYEDMPRRVTPDELLEETDDTDPPIREDGDRTCYMIYTSGSTGRPKGVEVSHKNLANLCLPVPENNYFYTRDPKPESVIQTATVSFDASILDLIPPLVNGIRVVFANDEENRNVDQLVKLIRKEKPEMLGDMTPSRLMQYLEDPEFAGEMKNFRACSVGGEPFLPALFYRLRELSDLDIYNSYGPTETTVHSNTRLIVEENIMSVGKALYNVSCDIRDLDGKMLPDGVVGELYIGGYGVSRGYHNMPEKTAETFVYVNGMRCFKSGDFAYRLENGEIVVMGRRDGQIKLRGLRIEIGEVEGSILAYEGVSKAAVVIRKIGRTEHLCAYYTAKDQVDKEGLKQFLMNRLTPYMVPTVLMQLDKMPYTPNGKLDRKNLPEPKIERDYTAPETEDEEFFCRVFEQVLGLDKVGAADDFFAIGGSSLLATQLTILAANGGYNIRFRDVFENPTPRKLAFFISGAAPQGSTEVGEEEKDIRDCDYSRIHRRLEENTFEAYLGGDRKDIRSVLLTGATGFLGIHVLRELLERENVKVCCMLRGRGKESAVQRLRSRLFYYFDQDYTELEGIRLFVREGAITGASDFDAFDGDSIDAVINCAASVKHFSAGTDIYDTNVKGVENGLNYAKKRGIRYVHISTTSTGGEILLDGQHEKFVYDERILYRGQALDNQYLASKFLAERLVLAAAADGEDAKVIRVGNLMARNEDGIFQMNFRTNGFINRLKAYVTLGQMPYSKMLQKTELSPVDITAKAIVALAGSPKACCLFNCYNNHTVSYGDILHAAAAKGLDIRPVTDGAFNEALDLAMRDASKHEGIYGLFTTVGMGTREDRILTPVSNDYTVGALYSEGIFWPVISERYLSSYIDFLCGLGFWSTENV